MNDASRHNRTPWGLVVLLGSLTGMGALAIDMYLPSLPAMGAELRASAGERQATMAFFLAGTAIGQFFYGPASDRWGRRPPVLLGVGIYILASIGCALATSPQMLIGMRFVQALGACGGGVVARAMVRDRFDHTESARMLSLMMLIMGVAPILSPLFGGVLLVFGGWRLIFWCMALFGLLLGAAAFLRMQESRSAETAARARAANPLQGYLALLRQRRLIGYILAGALNGATLFTYITSSPELVIQIYHVPAAYFGLVFGVNGVGLIGASQINRHLLRRRTPDQVLAVASLAAVVAGVALSAAAASGWGGALSVLPLLFVLLSSYAFVQGNTTAGALSVDPLSGGSTSALLGAAAFTAGAGASGLVGLFHDGTPRPMALIMLIAMSGSALSLHKLALPKRGRD